MGEECTELVLGEAVGALDVIGLVGFEEEQGARAMVCGPDVRKEQRVTCSHDRVHGEEPGVTMVGVEAVPLPGVVSEHHIGSEAADRRHELGPGDNPVFELTVGPTEELDVSPAAQGH